MTSVVAHLKAVGLTEWESRAYLALLEEAPASGYAIAKRSGVPRSKIYEVLESLVAKGAVHVARGDVVLYGPTAPDELIARLRKRSLTELDEAQAALGRYAGQLGGDAVIWDLEGRLAILERAHQLVRRATRRILLEIWARDADELRDDLADAASRGVEVITVAYGDPSYSFGIVHEHPTTDAVTAGLGGRWLVISVDNREVLAGLISAGRQSRAAWTTHQALVVPITELVAHDLYKLAMLESFAPQLEEKFGPGLQQLREKYSWDANG